MASKRLSVVIIGASHAGLGVSHKLLRQTTEASITLINPSDEYYFNIAAPRFLVKPESLSPTKYFYSIPKSFQQYPKGSFTFIKGLVTELDLSKGSVTVSTSSRSTVTVSYDYLVIASGSTTPATVGTSGLRLPFKATGFEDTKTAIRVGQEAIKNATSLLIAGGGPLGVEIAAELAEAAGPSKNVTLVSKTDLLLEGAPDSVKKSAESLLRYKNVEIIKATTVDRAHQDPATKKWTVTLSTGEEITTDAYISTTGVIPNNQFIPKSLLDQQGWVNVNEHLQVMEDRKSRQDIYAVGDITSHPYRLLSRIPVQASTVASNIAASIRKQGSLIPYSAEAQKKMMVVPVGESGGTGHVGRWSLPGLLVWYFKGRDFLVYKAPKFLEGKAD